MDWLGSIGGVNDILIAIMGFFFCGFAEFNCTIQSLKFLDLNTGVSEHEAAEESKLMNQSTCERIILYLSWKYKCLMVCCTKSQSEKMKKMGDRLDNGLEDFENDTNWKILLMSFKETQNSVNGIKNTNSVGGALKDKILGNFNL